MLASLASASRAGLFGVKVGAAQHPPAPRAHEFMRSNAWPTRNGDNLNALGVFLGKDIDDKALWGLAVGGDPGEAASVRARLAHDAQARARGRLVQALTQALELEDHGPIV